MECDWTLNDTERFISNKHIIVSYINNSFLLTDTSSNGAFINDHSEPLGKGNSHALQLHDKIKLGTFCIQVTAIDLAQSNSALLSPVSEPITPADSAAADSGLLDLVTNNSTTPAQSLPLETNVFGVADAPKAQEEQSRGLFDILSEDLAATSNTQPPFDEPNAESVDPFANKPPLNTPSAAPDPFAPTENNGQTIPDNWDLTDLDNDSAAPQASPAKVEPAASPVFEPEPQVPVPDPIPAINEEAVQQPAPAVAVQPPVATAQPNVAPVEQATPLASDGDDGFFTLLYEQLGLPKEYMHSVDKAVFAKELTQILMTSTQGIMALLAGRSVLKQESRLSMTMIKPQSNNPIKFSLDPSDTLEMLLVKKKPGYLTAQDAYSEAMNDLQAHQMAFVSGLQASLNGVLSELAPTVVEQEAEEKSRAFMDLKGSARKWQTFSNKQEKLHKQVNENLNDVLAKYFSRAYEAHINNAKSNN